MGIDDGIDKSGKDLGDQISSPWMACKVLGKAVDMTDQHGIIKPVLEHKEPATTAGFFPIPRQDCMCHSVETLQMKDVMMLKQAEGGLATLYQGPEPLTLIPCGSRQIFRRLLKTTPGQIIAAGDLAIKNTETLALQVQEALKLKGPPPDGGPAYSLRSIRATIEVLREAQDETFGKEGMKELYEKYFPKE